MSNEDKSENKLDEEKKIIEGDDVKDKNDTMTFGDPLDVPTFLRNKNS